MSTTTLPTLLSPEDIKTRLASLFPESFPDRGILVGPMAARVVYVFLYGGFVEGAGRYLRPSHVYLFTEEQAWKQAEDERMAWVASAAKPRFRPEGARWYADTSREPIRDDLMRNQWLRLGIMAKHTPPGHSITSSTPVNYLAADFAELFVPDLTEDDFQIKAETWRTTHLNQATLQRMALKAQGTQAKKGDHLLVDFPDGTRMRISSGASNVIVKALIEKFAPKHLTEPAVVWLSASDKKAYPQFIEAAKAVGLEFDLGAELPDLILVDLTDPVRFYMCEVVASDGPVSELRKEALLALIRASKVPEDCVKFLTAYSDREARPFKKTISQLALNTLVWFSTEPDLLVVLTTKGKKLLADA